ncbi:peptidase U32 [Paenibacillus selenitireducens]|uniref:Peptidase U32 n=1 Tax=Paenibacillus selenitireducens TaxID=1324314 RepID=A0A1T2XL82_9BACL|nr:peptidase U32 family protein [Paenibacillus selenitireducens]OPA80423.1 peptidase U32 [Paenibacillus selenitireducens]
MTKKPELLVTAGSLEQLQKYMQAGADAVLVGEQKYGMRLPGDMTLAHIREAVQRGKEAGVKIYVAVNNIMDNQVLHELPAYLTALQEAGVDAIVYGDPSVLMTVREAAPQLPLHWNAEMTSTNYKTATYWAKRGAKRVVLARELNMDQVLEMKEQLPNMEVEVQVHGMTNIYHSKRNLVKSYMSHQNVRNHDAVEVHGEDLTIDRGLFLIEQERQEEKYPIYEDINGTHIMSSDDICMLENIHELLEGRIDSLKIECLLKSDRYNETIIRSYRLAIDAYTADPENYEFQPEWLEAVQEVQDPERELSYGFFYKEQVY